MVQQQNEMEKFLPHHRRRGRVVIKDTVIVEIPMDVTADLGIAMRRCREKRLKKLRKRHPSLFKGDNASNLHDSGAESDGSCKSTGNGNKEGNGDEHENTPKKDKKKEKRKQEEHGIYDAEERTIRVGR